MIQHKDNQLYEKGFFSDLLGYIGVDKTLLNSDNDFFKEMVKEIVDEKIVNECKKLRYLIKNVIEKNLTVLYQIDYDNAKK